ncbi:MAG: hypothetical protein QGD88_13170 [Anaerolineae bacterium]|nr:hypothetical protein [Anaerolineae bacterium]
MAFPPEPTPRASRVTLGIHGGHAVVEPTGTYPRRVLGFLA